MSRRDIFPKVLIIEDDDRWQREYALALDGMAEIIPAYTLEEGRQKFRETRDIVNIIVMDACVPGENPNTPP